MEESIFPQILQNDMWNPDTENPKRQQVSKN